jgi:ubiquinone/menaquinone biosynthesis C-methylase UbiE
MEKILTGAGSARREPFSVAAPAALPAYLQETYWWAYLHPRAVRIFERQWLVNLILWGNYAKLRDAALSEVETARNEKILQIACVYGDFTERLAQRLGAGSTLDVIDVAAVQLENLRRKLKGMPCVFLHQHDSTQLRFDDACFDMVVVFFLLHEQPEHVRRKTIAEAIRVLRPGGKIVFVDYHRPSRLNPFRYIMIPILRSLEPFAMDLWASAILDSFAPAHRPVRAVKRTYFGGLYQKVTATC